MENWEELDDESKGGRQLSNREGWGWARRISFGSAKNVSGSTSAFEQARNSCVSVSHVRSFSMLAHLRGDHAAQSL